MKRNKHFFLSQEADFLLEFEKTCISKEKLLKYKLLSLNRVIILYNGTLTQQHNIACEADKSHNDMCLSCH